MGNLTIVDYERHIVGSGIADQVAIQRGYRTVTAADEDLLIRLGFTPEQRAHVPALLIPLHDIHGSIAGYELRPVVPRVPPDGRPAKYDRPPGQRSVLDVHPRAQYSVDDATVPLLITEGTKKADAALSAPLHTDRGLVLPIALQGVACWRSGSDGHAHGDWWRLKLRGRAAYICFDSDVMVKETVHAELVKLAAFLAAQGAVVRPIYLPPGPDGAKVGLDDFLVAGHTLTDALHLAEDAIRAPVGRRGLLTFLELLQSPTLPWLIEGLLPAEGITVVFGPWGAYKSFLVLDWLAVVAAGIPDWFGLKVQRHGPAVYVYAEGRAGLGQRAQALWLARRVPDDLPLRVWPTALDITDLVAVEQLIAEIGTPAPAIIAIDTLARNMPGRNENLQQDMAAFVAGCDRLRTAFGCQVVIVHHLNKSGEVRGSTVLPGAADTMIEVERTADRESRVTIRKQKDGREGAWLVRLRPETDSLVIAGAVAEDAREAARPGARDPLLDHERKLLVFRALARGGAAGLEYGAWFAASEASKGTFTAAKALMEDRELVHHDAGSGRYLLTPRGVEIAGERGWLESPY